MILTKMRPIFTILLCFSYIGCIYGALEKGCRISQLDTKLKPLTSWTREVKWAETEEDLSRFCSSYIKDVSQSREYLKKCVKGESKSIMSVSLHAMERVTVKTYCKNKNERKKILAAAKCANSASKTSAKCWTDNISRMTAINNATNSKDKIPMLCCSMLRWKDCFIKTYEDIGPPKCSIDNVETFDQYLYKSTIEPLNIFCTDFDDSDKCKKFESFMSKSVGNRVKYNTPFPAIINIFENL